MSGDSAFDVVVLGSGAAGLSAALFAALDGLSVCLIEKTERFGGTTAWSGGMVWAPLNHYAREAGIADSETGVLRYLDALVPGASDNPNMRAYLDAAPAALERLARDTAVQMQLVPVYPDYFSDLAGATKRGRVLEPVPFDARRLGPLLPRLRRPLPEFSLFGSMMVARPDLPHFRNFGRAPASTGIVLCQMARFGAQRILHGRGTALVLGNALVARFLASLAEAGVVLRHGTEVAGLTETPAGRIGGVRLSDGRVSTARRGVVLATGGFTHDPERRRAVLPPALADHSATFGGATGDGARLAESHDAAVLPGQGGSAFLAPVSRHERADGSEAVYPHTVVDRAKPGVIAVGSDGRRFVNEAVSYHEFAKAMLARDNGPNAHAWLIADASAVWKYGLGAVKPMQVSTGFLRRRGYLLREATLEALARRANLPAAALGETVARFNAAADKGEDPEFGKGSTVYQRFLGDADVAPNPCLAPVARPPFHAVRLVPGDLGAAGGIATDRHARVLDRKGASVPGLYACGADAKSVMEGHYPGPGITLGPAIAFGYLAAKHLSQQNGGTYEDS